MPATPSYLSGQQATTGTFHPALAQSTATRAIHPPLTQSTEPSAHNLYKVDGLPCIKSRLSIFPVRNSPPTQSIHLLASSGSKGRGRPPRGPPAGNWGDSRSTELREDRGNLRLPERHGGEARVTEGLAGGTQVGVRVRLGAQGGRRRRAARSVLDEPSDEPSDDPPVQLTPRARGGPREGPRRPKVRRDAKAH